MPEAKKVPSAEAMLIIRFSEAMYQTCKNSLTKQLMVTNNYGGRVVGVAHANEVKILSGDWPLEKGIAMLIFPSMVDAKRWENSTPEVRQSDWLGGVDIIVAPCKAAPASCVTPLQLVSFRAYPNADMGFTQSEEAKQIPKVMEDCHVSTMVMTTDVERLRGAWSTHMFMVNQFQSKSKYQEFSENGTVKKMRSIREAAGETSMQLVQMQPLKAQ